MHIIRSKTLIFDDFQDFTKKYVGLSTCVGGLIYGGVNCWTPQHLDNWIPFYCRAYGNQPGNNAWSRAQPAATTWCKAAQEQRRSWERNTSRGTRCPVKVRKIYFKNFRQFAKKISNVQWKALWLKKSPKRYPPRKYMKKTSGNLQKNQQSIVRGNVIEEIANKMSPRKYMKKVPAIRKKITQCTVRGRCRRQRRRTRSAEKIYFQKR